MQRDIRHSTLPFPGEREGFLSQPSIIIRGPMATHPSHNATPKRGGHGEFTSLQISAGMGLAPDPALREDGTPLTKSSAPTVLLRRSDERYPRLLSAIPAIDQPRLLYCHGDAALLSTPCVSIVGCRNATPAGLSRTHQLAVKLATAGYTIVSGLARGIDTAAHKGALAAGGKTVAVLGTSLERAQCYPSVNAPLEDRIVAAGGLLVSEYAEGDGSPARFKARDRIIAALGLAVIPIQAERLSGTLVTIRRARLYGKPIWCLRPPAEESQARQYQGIHDLLADTTLAPFRVFSDQNDVALLDEIHRPARAAIS